MKCYLLEKRIRFLEELLEMRQESCEKSIQTDGDLSDAETEIEESPDLLDRSVMEREYDEITETIRFIQVKTEDRRTDVLFWFPPLRLHFIQDDTVFTKLSEYNGKYISLNRIVSFTDKGFTGAPDERDQYDRIVFLRNILTDRTPFVRRLRISHEYESFDTSSLCHRSLRSFRFIFQKI